MQPLLPITLALIYVALTLVYDIYCMGRKWYKSWPTIVIFSGLIIYFLIANYKGTN